jgi:P27 family predicted phage terminase small subunit
VPRRAKTDQEHFLHGTVSQVGRSKTTQAPSAYAGGRPTIPGHLGKIARAEFKRVCFELEKRRTLTSGDRLTIAVLAEAYERWVTAKAELGNAYTITVSTTDKNGNTTTSVKPNPLVKIVEVCEARILSLQSALGLTPQARDKVRPTQFDPSLTVVPGSIADKYPELVGGPRPVFDASTGGYKLPQPLPPPEGLDEESEEPKGESDGTASVD